MHTKDPKQFLSKLELEGIPFDRILVAFSGGKDSLACVLHLLELGVPKDRIELHHHDIDAGGEDFMDWPCTPAYCRAVAAHLGIPIYFSYREGGFKREMERKDTPTAPVFFEKPDGTFGVAGGKGPGGTRGKFPQVSADLSVRWCSAYLKIDVMRRAIANQDRFLEGNTLVVTGERAEESPSRSRYKEFEPHACHNNKRSVWAWRPVHSWTEKQVWDIIERHKIRPHLAYELGWGRLSCMSCIFGSPNQWATIRYLFPAHFEKVASMEQATGCTIQRKRNIRELADAGTVYPAAKEELADFWATLAQRKGWELPIHARNWTLPAGAFGESTGPT